MSNARKKQEIGHTGLCSEVRSDNDLNNSWDSSQEIIAVSVFPQKPYYHNHHKGI